MNKKISEDFKNLVTKHFNKQNKNVRWDEFKNEWDELYKDNLQQLKKTEVRFLDEAYSEFEDILIHMPAMRQNDKAVDWERWQSEGDYIKFLFLREAIDYMDISAFKSALKNDASALSVGNAWDEELIKQNIHKKIEKYI